MTNYYEKYIKYKLKYLNLASNNKIGGGLTNEQINLKISEMQEKGLTKTKIIACILSLIMKSLNITNQDYMIIAGYCLHKIREIGDLDVVVNKSAYKKLKKSKLLSVSKAKITGDERLYIKFPEIDEEAEIEFFPKKETEGFPSNEFSLQNMQKNNNLDYDEYSNPYYNLESCIKQYSDVNKKDGKFIISSNFEISKDRVLKNISHLEKIKEFTQDSNIKKLCGKKIKYLSSLLD